MAKKSPSLLEKKFQHGVEFYPKPASIRFTIPMEPRGKGRARGIVVQGKNGAKATVRFIPDPDSHKWELAFAQACSYFAPHKGVLLSPLRVDILAIFPRPEYMMKPTWPDGLIYMASVPDQDNVRKIVLDAMTKSKVFWDDDRQIVAGETRTCYREKDGEDRVIVKVREATKPPVSADVWP